MVLAGPMAPATGRMNVNSPGEARLADPHPAGEGKTQAQAGDRPVQAARRQVPGLYTQARQARRCILNALQKQNHCHLLVARDQEGM